MINEVPDQTRAVAVINRGVLVMDAPEADGGQQARPAEAGTGWADDPNRVYLHAMAVRAYRAGNAMIWITCACAERIVGTYKRGATLALATDIGRSVDTVEDMAHASELYHRLMRYFRGDSVTSKRKYRYLVPQLRDIRRRLYYSHFATMWTIWRQRPDMTPLDVFSQLETASAEGIGTRGMDKGASGSEGTDAIILPVWNLQGEDAKRILDYMVDPSLYPDSFIVLLQGAEWLTVGSVKVKPA